MGVYVFQTVCDWVKVGHHLTRPRRPNPYYRIAGRGFQGCVHPPELEGLLWWENLTLVAWYPSLSPSDERGVHKTFAGRVGEFHSASLLPSILAHLDALGEREGVEEAAKKKAKAWGERRVRRARRRKKKAQ